MIHTYRILQTNTDFFVAALSQVRVSIWHVLDDKEHIMDYGGTVEEYSPLSIKIMGNRYLRELYEFRIKTRYIEVQRRS